MSDGAATFQAWIDRLARLGRSGLADVAKEAAPLVEKAARATAAAGTSPDGEPWAPRKKDGGRAMADAASHVSAKASGPTIRITLEGPDVFQHYGVRGEPRRQVIPVGDTVPASIGAALEKAAANAFARTTHPTGGT